MKKIKKVNFILYILLIVINTNNPRLERFSAQPQSTRQQNFQSNQALQQDQYGLYDDGQGNYFYDAGGTQPLSARDMQQLEMNGSNYNSDDSDDYNNDTDSQGGGLQQDPSTGLYTDGQGNYFYDDQGTQPVSPSDMQQIQAMMAGGDPSSEGPQTFTQKADNLANEIMGFWGVQAVFILGMAGIEVGEIPHWVKNQYGNYELKKYVGKNLQGDITGNQAEVQKFLEFSKKNPQLIQQEMNKKPQETADIYKGIMKLDKNNQLKQKFLKDLEEHPTFFKAVASLDNQLGQEIISENPEIFDSMEKNNSSQYDEIMNQKSMQNLEKQAQEIKQTNDKKKQSPNEEDFKNLQEKPLKKSKNKQLSPEDRLNFTYQFNKDEQGMHILPKNKKINELNEQQKEMVNNNYQKKMNQLEKQYFSDPLQKKPLQQKTKEIKQQYHEEIKGHTMQNSQQNINNEKMKNQQLDIQKKIQTLEKQKQQKLKQKNDIDIAHENASKQYKEKATTLKNYFSSDYKNNSLYATKKTDLEQQYLPIIQEHLQNSEKLNQELKQIQLQQKQLQLKQQQQGGTKETQEDKRPINEHHDLFR
jgi:hypothetical protein